MCIHVPPHVHLCLDVYAYVCMLVWNRKLRGKKPYFSGWCVRRPLTTDRPQSERSCTAACTEKQERSELTGHPAVACFVAKAMWSKMDTAVHIHTYTLIHACMQAHIHRSHLAGICPLVCKQSITAACMLNGCKVRVSAYFTLFFIYSHTDKTRIEMLHKPISTSALPESRQLSRGANNSGITQLFLFY